MESCFKTNTALISLEEGLYIKFSILNGAVIDEEDAIDNVLVIKNLSGDKRMLKLLDIRGKWEMTKKAREISKKYSSAKNTIARAYVTDSFLSKLMMSFFESFAGSDIPQKFFSNEKEAVLWLRSQQALSSK